MRAQGNQQVHKNTLGDLQRIQSTTPQAHLQAFIYLRSRAAAYIEASAARPHTHANYSLFASLCGLNQGICNQGGQRRTFRQPLVGRKSRRTLGKVDTPLAHATEPNESTQATHRCNSTSNCAKNNDLDHQGRRALWECALPAMHSPTCNCSSMHSSHRKDRPSSHDARW